MVQIWSLIGITVIPWYFPKKEKKKTDNMRL